MSFVRKLKCARCNTEYSLDDKLCMCPKKDEGRLDISYDYSALSERINKNLLSKRPPSVWKYFELLPIKHKRNIVTLAAGGTPLSKASRLAEKVGLKKLFLKDETRNPTGSFKDRAMTVGVSKALEFGAKITVTASSGNAATALAAYSAKAGLDCYAFVLDTAPDIKLSQISYYGAKVRKVKPILKGEDPTVNMLKLVVQKYGWYSCPSFGPFNPYQVEGPKTIVYEILEQLDWTPPEWILVPTGSGCLAAGLWKGLKDYYNLGFIDSLSRIAIIQAEGCAPLVRAFKANTNPLKIEPWTTPNTVAGGLADVFPWDGDAAISALKETNGVAETVSDKVIIEAQRLLASTEGIFAEPTGVASLAGLVKLVNEGVIKTDESVVVLVTGSGLKDPDFAMNQFKKAPVIKPNLEEFRASFSTSSTRRHSEESER